MKLIVVPTHTVPFCQWSRIHALP